MLTRLPPTSTQQLDHSLRILRFLFSPYLSALAWVGVESADMRPQLPLPTIFLVRRIPTQSNRDLWHL